MVAKRKYFVWPPAGGIQGGVSEVQPTYPPEPGLASAAIAHDLGDGFVGHVKDQKYRQQYHQARQEKVCLFHVIGIFFSDSMICLFTKDLVVEAAMIRMPTRKSPSPTSSADTEGWNSASSPTFFPMNAQRVSSFTRTTILKSTVKIKAPMAYIPNDISSSMNVGT